MRRNVGPAIIALLIAGCASAPPEPVAVVRAPPKLPERSSFYDVPVPAKDAEGRYITVNSGIGPLETMFHFRSAMNVSALTCGSRGSFDPIAAYNVFLKTHSGELSNANRAIDAKYRRENGREGNRVRDGHMTSVYNYFAAPSVKQTFCELAQKHLETANAVPRGKLEAWSQEALADIENVFQSHFSAVEKYRSDWDAYVAGHAAGSSAAE